MRTDYFALCSKSNRIPPCFVFTVINTASRLRDQKESMCGKGVAHRVGKTFECMEVGSEEGDAILIDLYTCYIAQ